VFSTFIFTIMMRSSFRRSTSSLATCPRSRGLVKTGCAALLQVVPLVFWENSVLFVCFLPFLLDLFLFSQSQ